MVISCPQTQVKKEGGDTGRFSIRQLYNFVDFLLNSVWLVVKTFQIVIYRRDNFVYHLWGYTSINRPQSYPFRYLLIKRMSNLLVEYVKRHWSVLYGRFLIRQLYNFVDFNLILLGWFIKLSTKTFQIVIYRRNNFVYYHWECTSI